MTAPDLVAELARLGWKVALSGDGPFLTRTVAGAAPPPAELVAELKARRADVVVAVRAERGLICSACRAWVHPDMVPHLASPHHCPHVGCPYRGGSRAD